MYMHILISTDGSEVAQKGVDHGLSLAKALGARVTIVTATERFPPAGLGGWTSSRAEMQVFENARMKAAAEILAAAGTAAEKIGVEAETVHVPNAFPADAVLETATERHCSLIVMASHGRRGLERVLLGSQAAEVLARSPIPVLVVR